MATWTELIEDIYTLTNRRDLVSETAIALRQAVRIAHRSGKYWRDLVTVPVSVAVAEVQTVDLPTVAPRFRAVGLLTSYKNKKIEFDGLTIDDLLDHDGQYKTNVYWGVGTSLKIRAAEPEALYELSYFQYPVVTEAGFNSWVAQENSDLLILLAASSVLATVGEQEIKNRLDALAAVELQGLKNSNIEAVGR